ncbi:hypothetical protein JZ751_004104 [Albula glossodonta]|uniref:Uncharacterized protein n=1 Tax=Albula glossodonta TaxID=121402 RepID=A0A8T2P750_9TELE|nr:hypothetical protein JZ751_004104 [Albula glossodonta]
MSHRAGPKGDFDRQHGRCGGLSLPNWQASGCSVVNALSLYRPLQVEEVKKHSHCLAFSSSGPQSQTYYISFDNFTEHLRWQRQAAKVRPARPRSLRPWRLLPVTCLSLLLLIWANLGLASQSAQTRAVLSGFIREEPNGGNLSELIYISLEQLPPNLFYSQDLTHLNLKQNFLSPGLGLAELQRYSPWFLSSTTHPFRFGRGVGRGNDFASVSRLGLDHEQAHSLACRAQ